LNPNGKIPTTHFHKQDTNYTFKKEEGDIVMFDGMAILMYLLHTYDKGNADSPLS
jgi:glutathione S-transferase